ncbi:MAG: hypothetical protein HY081_11730 [Gammaproteobacteria bacterium]|nr:hypothetical protein [Gammaproteobacteria bacterium]
MLRPLFLLVFLLANSSAFAYFYDGNKLVVEMREFEKAERSDPRTNYQSSSQYIGFVVGVHDAIATTLCSSGDISVRQVTTIVAKYLNERPEEWNKPAFQLVSRALWQAFPCKSTSPPKSNENKSRNPKP